MLATTSPAQAPLTHDAPPVWTFADLVSTYRYWALFIAYVLTLIGLAPSTTVLMSMRRSADLTFLGSINATISPVMMTIIFIIAVAAPPWRIKWIWLFLTLLNAIALLVLWANTSYATSPSLLLLYLCPLILLSYSNILGLPMAALLASALMSARSKRIDLITAFGLLAIVPIILSKYSYLTTIMMLRAYTDRNILYVFMLGCLLCAALALSLARPLTFDSPPRVRHAPLARRQRWSMGVTLISLLPMVIAAILFGLNLTASERLSWNERGSLALPEIFFILCSLAYIGYWCYRIHGELADRAPSQHLLTPIAAALMAVFVPLALPILLITLGRILNTRGATVSIGWLAFWSLLMPPVAMGVIQNAANAQ